MTACQAACLDINFRLLLSLVSFCYYFLEQTAFYLHRIVLSQEASAHCGAVYISCLFVNSINGKYSLLVSAVCGLRVHTAVNDSLHGGK